MLNILRSIPGITKASLVHMRREFLYQKHYACISKGRFLHLTHR